MVHLKKIVSLTLALLFVLQLLPIKYLGMKTIKAFAVETNPIQNGYEFDIPKESDNTIDVEIPPTFICSEENNKTVDINPSEILWRELTEEEIEFYKIVMTEIDYSKLTNNEKTFIKNYTGLSDTDLNFLESKEYSILDSANLSALAFELYCSPDDIISTNISPNEMDQIYNEFYTYQSSIKNTFAGSDADKELRSYFLQGFTCNQIVNAYGVSEIFNIPIQEAISDEYYIMNFLDFSDDENNINIDKVPTSGEPLTSERVKKYSEHIKQKINSIMENYSPTANTVIYDYEYNFNFLGSPFFYDNDEHEKVTLNTGNFSYTNVDFVIPGKNGLDLVIARRFDAQSANVYKPKLGYDYRTREYFTSWEEDLFSKELYGLGNGWFFAFSTIEIQNDAKYLHLSDGSSYSISSSNTLEDYLLDDIHFSSCSETISGLSSKAAYKLTYQDGKTEYFSSDGKIICIKDRFNNAITFEYTTLNNLPHITITDTLNNQVVISGAPNETGHTITVSLPNNLSLSYDVEVIENSGLSIAKYHDVEGNVTNYSYTSFNGHFTIEPSTVLFAYAKYILPRIITYPTLAQTKYYFGELEIRLDKEGRMRVPYLSRRNDLIENNEYNTIRYRMQKDYTGETDGYTPETLPSSYEYGIIASDYEKGICTSTIFNNIHVATKVATFYDDIENSKTIKEVFYEYNNDRLPIKETVRQYNSDATAYMQSITMTEYDGNGNVTAEWSSLANGVKSDIYKTSYVYDTIYYLPLSTEYYLNNDTKITIQNTLSNSNKTIASTEVLVNNSRVKYSEYSYDLYGNLTSEKSFKDDNISYYETNYTYSNNAYLSRIENIGIKDVNGDYVNSNQGILTTNYVYDNLGHIISSTDSGGNTVSYLYNNLGEVILATNPDNSTVSYGRDYVNNHVIITDENNNSIKYTYNQLGLEFETVDVATGNVITRKEYDNSSRLVKVYEYIYGSVTEYTYDCLDRVTSETVKQGDTILSQILYSYEYAVENGTYNKVTKTVVGDSNAPSIVTTEYTDKHGNVAKTGKVINGVEYFDTYAYDYVGNQTSVLTAADAAKNLSFTAKYEYNHDGQVTKTYNANNQHTTNVYDPFGNMVSSMDYKGTPTTYTYDALNRLTSQTITVDQGETSTSKYEYDGNGNIIREWKQNNVVGAAADWAKTEYTYDNRNRLTSVKQYNGDTIASTTSYTYDGVGNVLTMTAGGKTTTYTYDRFGNVLTETDALGQTESYEYSDLGKLESKTERNGIVTVYGYDALGRTVSVSAERNGETESKTFTYTKTGQILTESNGNSTTVYSYDELGQVITVEETADTVSDGWFPTKEITVSKQWEDNIETHDDITVNVNLSTEEEPRTITLGEDNNWTVTLNDIHEDATVTVEELNVPVNYSVSYSNDGQRYIVTNTANYKEITITKEWVDNLSEHEPVTVNVIVSNEDSPRTIVLSDENNWTISIDDIPRDSTVTLEEQDVPYGYDVSYSSNDGNYTITNTYNESLFKTIAISKQWEDNLATHPDVIVEVNISSEESPRTITLGEDNNWITTLGQIPVNATVSVTEPNVPEGYSVTYENNGNNYIVKNTTIYKEVHITKLWEDSLTSHDDVAVNVSVSGESSPRSIILGESNNWSVTLDDVLADASVSVEEQDVPYGYNTTYSDDGEYFVITNTYDESLFKTIVVTKEWEDNLESHSDITVEVAISGESSPRLITLGESNNWTASLSEIPVNATVTVTEQTVPEGYTVSYENSGNNYVITNTTIYKEIYIAKLWEDSMDLHDDITVNVAVSGESAPRSVVLGESNNWSVVLGNVPIDATVSVEEQNVPSGYDVAYSNDGNYYIITNTAQEPEPEPPVTHTITLDPNGGTISTATVTVEEGGTYNLPVPSKTGYTFSGWSYGDAIIQNGDIVSITEDATFIANWTANTYTVTYHSNVSILIDTKVVETFTYDVAKRLVCPSFSKKGYYISGWSATKNGTTIYTYNQQVTNLTSEQGGNIDLYAVWKAGNTSIVSIEDEASTFALNRPNDLTESSVGYTKSYTYDLAGNRIGFTLEKSGETVHNINYSYDNLNRLSTVSENGAIEATYTYDANGNRATLTLGNGVVTTYSYNLANWVTNLSNKNSDGEVLSSYTYTYYTSGNQKSKTEDGVVTNYVYDDLGRLTSESETGGVTLNYTYDAAGNRTKLTATGSESYVTDYSYNAVNQLTSEVKTIGGTTETTTYIYDANGNTLSVMEPGSIRVNEYNLFNELVATNANGSYAAYAYNANGIRTAKSVNGTCTSFLLDGGNVVGEVQNGEVTATHLRGANLLSTTSGTSTSYYLFNAHGDVTGLANGAQTVTKAYEYDAFGVEKDPSITDENPFRYCGEYFDKETGTYYLRARYYDPAIGRFTQQDTHWNTANMIYGDNPSKINEREDALGLKTYTYTPSISSIMQSGNLYVYGLNNPIYYCDFSGSFACTVTGALAGGIVAAFNVWTDSEKDSADFWSYVAAGAACGAIAGAAVDIAVATGGVAMFVFAGAMGGAMSVANTLIDESINCKRTGQTFNVSSGEIFVSFGIGSISNMLTFGLARGSFAVRGGNVFYNMIDDSIDAFTPGMTKIVSPANVTKHKQIPKFLNMFFESSSDGVVVMRSGPLASVTCVLSNVAKETAQSLIVAGGGNIYARYTSSVM